MAKSSTTNLPPTITKSKLSSQSQNNHRRSRSNSSICFLYTSIIITPILAATVLYFRADPFDPAPFPQHDPTLQKSYVVAPRVNGKMLQGSGFVGTGRVMGPEDVAYDPGSRVVYTGCEDGWVKRVRLSESVTDSVVEDWVNTGGRPLGLAIAGNEGEVIVADAYKGLMKITKDREMKLLATEAEGQRFKLTDGVDVMKDGTIYFTDASYKYTTEEHIYDILEGRPYGRLLSFNPETQETTVLLRDLYFPNGVAISPDQESAVFCETPLKRCRRYWLQGSKRGSVESFIDNLPGFPDNIHSDGKSEYLIAISSSLPPYLDRLIRHRLVRKSMIMMERHGISLRFTQKNGGILAVDFDGNPTAHLYDPALSLITSGIKVENHLFIGSLHYPHIIHFNLSTS